MGYKDDKWREAPDYCVECDNFRPLNKVAVCQSCWESGPSGQEDWEEDPQHSERHYVHSPDSAAASRINLWVRSTSQTKKDAERGLARLNRLQFGREASLPKLFSSVPGYSVREVPAKVGIGVFFDGELVARCFRKHELYEFLEDSGIDWWEVISRRLLPDYALLVMAFDTLFTFEMNQKAASSVVEKLQTCDFKHKQYLRLVSKLGLRVECVYVLNDRFRKPEFEDVLDYIRSVNCSYQFEEIPLAWLGLPARTA
ncbi:MAG TPA: hypothetical protein VGM19_14800 [Armatimonadota bacterium]|jgi:hypothetical protein